MATHSYSLVWEISQTEEPSRLQSLGSWRVQHDWAHMHARVIKKGTDIVWFYSFVFYHKSSKISNIEYLMSGLYSNFPNSVKGVFYAFSIQKVLFITF